MRLHHIAYVTKDIKKKADIFCSIFGFKRNEDNVMDKNQDVNIALLEMGDGVQLELLEPIGSESPVSGFLSKGGGIYHLCFEVEDLDGLLDRLERNKEARVVKKPAAAPAFGGRRVAFVATRDKDLVEFIEKSKR